MNKPEVQIIDGILWVLAEPDCRPVLSEEQLSLLATSLELPMDEPLAALRTIRQSP